MIIKNNMEVYRVLKWIEDQDMVAYDDETTGLNVRKDEIIGFAVTNSVEGFYIAHKAWDGKELCKLVDTRNCCYILEAILNKKLVAWNASFDLRFTKNYFGVDLFPALYAEGMLVKHQVDENPPFQLKQVGKKLFGEDAIKEQEAMKIPLVADAKRIFNGTLIDVKSR